MKVSYYPGCSLEGIAREYDESTQAVCNQLGIELCELDDWNCCGASSAHNTSDFLGIALPARNLVIAERSGWNSLIVPCSACYQRFKVVEKELAKAPRSDIAYQGGVIVQHLVEFLSDNSIMEQIKEKVNKPLAGLKVACYYGCLMVRPPKITGSTNHEDPQSMDQLMALLGAESRSWSYKTDCCGGSLSLFRTDIVKRLSHRLLEMALEAEADCLVTCCPMCQVNLESHQEEISAEFGRSYQLPILYFTELIGLAMQCRGVDKWLAKHVVDPRQLLASKGLL